MLIVFDKKGIDINYFLFSNLQHLVYILKNYVHVMDSLYKENTLLIVKQEEIQGKLEDLYVKQKDLSKKHESEIKVIYNASADEHAKWLCSKVDSLKRNSNLYDNNIK